MSRGARGGAFYCVDSLTGKRTSLGTVDRDAAEQIVLARNQALRQPSLNLHIAKAYLAGSDSGVNTRTWGDALNAIVESKHGPTRSRWAVAAKDKAFDGIRDAIIIETRTETLLEAIRRGTVSTNVHLRKLHNFAVDLGWLPWPVIPKRQWPAVRFGEKRAIRLDEHLAIPGAERNPERRAFYELCWHLGGSQGDIANLSGEDVDWEQGVISYRRQKTKTVAMLHIGDELAATLRQLPVVGPFFPYLRTVRPCDRATEFKQRCQGLGIRGVTLHSYRYAWAERAKQCGYPERFAQEALGHNSKAVHRAYSRRAQVVLPSIEETSAAPRTAKSSGFPSLPGGRRRRPRTTKVVSTLVRATQPDARTPNAGDRQSTFTPRFSAASRNGPSLQPKGSFFRRQSSRYAVS
jgi:integrase